MIQHLRGELPGKVGVLSLFYNSFIMPITMDTRQQNFWVENIEKEAALRFAWQLRYSKQFAKNIRQQPPGKQDPPVLAGKSFKQNITDQIEKIQTNKLPVINGSGKERTGSSQSQSKHTGRSSPATSTSSSSKLSRKVKFPKTDMRPSTARTKALLYDGISAHEEGRLAYLRKRKLIKPEDKFEFPVLSSCQYGWKILDYIKEPQRSKFARTCIVRDTFYRSSGIDIGHVV